MFRQIANRVKGRTKLIDENPSLQEALALLMGFNGNTRGRIHSYYHSGFTDIGLGKVALRDIVDFVRDNFQEQDNYYNKIRHQVYSGEGDERHYLDLAQGEIEGRFRTNLVKGSPFRKASIDFVVKKEQ